MAEQAGTDPSVRSLLDQAAADDSITRARTRAVDPVPIVAEPGGATLEPALETGAEPPVAVRDVGINRRLDPEVQAVDGRTAAPAPLAGARRRLSPRPVPVSRRRRPPAPATVTADEEPTPAEEMDDVGTHDEKAGGDKAVTPPAANNEDEAAARAATATATVSKPSRPKTAAEIVAEQRAREQAAAESAPAGAGKDPAETAVTKPVSRVPAASTAAAKPAASGTKATPPGKGKQALTSVGSGVRKLRNLIASLVWLVAVLAAAVLALGALFTALDQTNQSNEIVRWVLERGHDLVGPFKDLFRLETAKNTLLVNWGIAALVYLVAGKIIERFVRP
ncbi:hypothetical protein E1218_12860 [Kribbella turkmenica]|uniref:Uncharacterized protein n=1 Tax=Kribbella turkmenica TaxID=2530375 RepID=A0A4R4X818_9ACTN|nr:hypothetical protein [Kribbella turkmenica]TDD26611.1 hypothetical protein E1218_12860 [Kribbella turkmenica]